MKKAIYKIKNLINGKIYIGQSSNPERRWQDHINNYNPKDNSLISKAIKKYGVQNFSFDIIGWFDDYNDKEKYYINYYNSVRPYGYNIQLGGEEPPHPSGEDHPCAKIDEKTARKIQEQALNWLIPRRQIVKDNKITFDMFRHINEGTSWRREELKYPLRPNETIINEWKADKVIELLKNSSLTQKEIGQQVGWNRSAVTMINLGKNHRRDNLSYPIRK